MSIRDAINKHDGSELFCLAPLFPGELSLRTIYVSYEVAELVLWREQSNTREDCLAEEARALLDYFVEGGSLTIGMDPFKKDGACIMARVYPIDKGIFDFRCLDPAPGLRILGAFSEVDTFIALTWDTRDQFEENWSIKVTECENEWKRLFGPLTPLAGSKANDFVSYNVKAV